MNIIKIFVLSIALITFAAPQKSNALMTTAYGIPYAGPIGLAVFTTIGAVRYSHLKSQGKDAEALSMLLLHILGGIIILDEEDLESVEFKRISTSEAIKLGISDAEKNQFNSKVTALNQIGKAIAKKCIQTLQSLKEVDIASISMCAEQGWDDFRLSNPRILTNEIFNVIQTIRHQQLED